MDFAVLGFDDQPIASLTYPEITTIRQPIEEMGALATKTLISSIEGTPPIEMLTLKTQLIIRDSV